MAFKQVCLLALCLMALVAPSLQEGAIYTDFINTVRAPSTHFEGVSSNTVTVADASVGTLASNNEEGFFINSDGPVTIDTDTVSITGAQLVDFTGTDGTGSSSTISSGGTLNFSGTRLDVDAGTFTGSGLSGSFSSGGELLFQGGDVTLGNSQGRVSLSADENDVRIRAAQGLSIDVDDTSLSFTNAVSMSSDIGGVSFSGASAALNGNLVDIRSENAIRISSASSQAYQAASIVELRSDNDASISAADDLTVSASANTIVFNSATTTGFSASGDFTATSAGAISLQTIGDSDNDISLSATGTLTLDGTDGTATIAAITPHADVIFENSGDLTASSQGTLSLGAARTASLVSGQADITISGAELDVSATNKNVTIHGGVGGVQITATASGTIDLSANDIFSTSAGGTVLATNGDITIDAGLDFGMQQRDGDEQNSGNFNFNVESDLVLSADTIEVSSSGRSVYQAGTGAANDLTVVGDVSLDITTGAQGYDVQFTSNVDEIVVSATTRIDTFANEYSLSSSSDIDINGEEIVLLVTDIAELSLDAGLNIDIDAEGPLIFDASRVNSIAASDTFDIGIEEGASFVGQDLFLDAVGNIFMDAPFEFDVNADLGMNIEAEGDVTITAEDDVSLVAESSLTLTAESVTLASGEDMSVEAQDSISFVSNFPDDLFSVTAEEISISGAVTGINSGGDVTISSDEVDLEGEELTVIGAFEINFNGDDLEILSDETTEFDSSGELEAFASDIDFSSTGIEITASAPNGDGVALFSAASDMAFAADSIDEEAGANFSIDSADIVDLTASEGGAFVGEDEFVFDASDTFASVSTDSTTVSGANSINIDSVDFVGSGATQDWQISSLVVDTSDFGIEGQSSVTLDSTNIRFEGDELDVQVGTIFTINTPADVTYTADDLLTFDAANDIILSVGGDFNIVGSESTMISADVVTYNGGILIIDAGQEASVESDGDINASGSEVNAVGEIIEVDATDINFTATGTAGISVVAYDGEISSIQSGDVGISTIGATPDAGDLEFEATGNIRLHGSLSFRSDGVVEDLGLGASNPGIYVHTTDARGDIVFDYDTEGSRFNVNAGDAFSVAAGQHVNINSQSGQENVMQSGLNINSGEDFVVRGADEVEFNAQTGLNLVTNGMIKSNIESNGPIEFVGRGNTLGPTDPAVTVDAAADLIVSTSQKGGLSFESEANLSFSAGGSAAIVVTKDISATSGGLLVTAVDDFVVATTGGSITLESEGDFTETATNNIDWESGRDVDLVAETIGSMTSIVGSITAHAENGAMQIITDGDSTFTAGRQIIINAEGARTDPEDGVALGADNIMIDTPTGVVVNAFDSVVVGRVTNPSATLTLAGTVAAPGLSAVSDGPIRVNSDAIISLFAEDSIDITTSDEISVLSDGTLSIVAEGMAGSTDLRVQATNGIVHFHAEETLTATATDNIVATATTGHFHISGTSRMPGSRLLFGNGNDITVTASNLLSNSGLLQKPDGGDLTIDGSSSVSIASSVGSVGSIDFSAESMTATAFADMTFVTNSQDAPIAMDIEELESTAEVSGDINLSAARNLDFFSRGDVTITSLNTFSITANSEETDEGINGSIYFASRNNDVSFAAGDQIEFQAEEDFELFAGGVLEVVATDDASFIADEDIIFRTDSLGFTFDSSSLLMENSPEGEGDIYFRASGIETVSFESTGDVFVNAGRDYILSSGDDVVITASGVDSITDIGLAIETTAEGGDILFAADEISIEAFGPAGDDANAFTTQTGSIVISGEDTLSSQSLGSVSVSATDTTSSSSLRSAHGLAGLFAGGAITIDALGEDGPGSVLFQADGLISGGTDAMVFTAESDGTNSAIVIQSQGNSTTAGNSLSVTGSQGIEFNLLGRFAYFGAFDEDVVNVDVFDPSSANDPLFGDDPEQQETLIESLGLKADILFSSREGQDGFGEIHIISGVVDRLGFYDENVYYSAEGRDDVIQIVADGSDSAEIRFDVESGIIFRGMNTFGNSNAAGYVVESDADFFAAGEHGSISITTTENAIGAGIDVFAHNTLFESRARGFYGTLGETGAGPVTLKSTRGSTSFTTSVGGSGGSDSGIRLEAMDSKLHIDAFNGNTVDFVSGRDMDVRADDGLSLRARELVIDGGSLNFRSDNGDITFRVETLAVGATNIEIGTRSDEEGIFGDDVIFRTNSDVSFIADNGSIVISTEGKGNIYFHFGGTLEIIGPTFVSGYMTFPMTQEDIRPGDFCNSFIQDNEIVIAKQQIYTTEYQSVISNTGTSVCLCSRATSRWNCMNMTNLFY